MKLQKRSHEKECAHCMGTGVQPLTCPVCLGTNVAAAQRIVCPICLASGMEICRTCEGSVTCTDPDCLDGYEKCDACSGEGCEKCAYKKVRPCFHCDGVGCAECGGSGREKCRSCGGRGICPDCWLGSNPCPWCRTPDHRVEILSLWDKSFRSSSESGNVRDVMFFQLTILSLLPKARRRILLEYVTWHLSRTGFPKARLQELWENLLDEKREID